MILSATVLDLIRLRRGMKETSRNRGPEIDEYHRAVGLDPAGEYAWCCSGMYYMHRLAVQQIGGGMVNPFPRTASCESAWRHIEPICKLQNPVPGALYFLKHTNGWHVGIVETCEGGSVTTELSGNTFAEKGGREGNQWARHLGQPEVTHGGELQGYAQLDLANQPPHVVG